MFYFSDDVSIRKTNMLLEVFDSGYVPDDMFISTLVGPRLHASCREESHLLTANYPQLMPEFTLILRMKDMWYILLEEK